jgi:N-carbamoyl-L-amino-acid hydrolase
MPDADRKIASAIALATRAAVPVAESLFRELAIRTADGEGVTRDSYGKGEQIAHDLLTAAAERIGLEVDRDPAGNLYMTLPGADRDAPAWFVGSHLDSVLHGGNFDGAAGVVAGVTALAALKDLGLRPPRDITVMGTRAEECSTWFVGHHGGHLGSRAALGLLWPGEMDTAVHVHSGRTFAQCMDDAGFDSSYFRESHPPVLSPRTVHGYLEVHIEQGPVLHERGYPVGVVTGIRGCLRARSARTTGVYTHSGAVPQDMRRDAVLATAELVLAIENECRSRLDSGQDIVFAAGKFHTDAEHHSIVKVPGDVRFALDIRSQDRTVLDDMRVVVDDLVAEINHRRRVTIDLGDVSLVTPATMDPGYMRHMRDGCAVLDIPFMDIPSGAGHDAADFHDAGIPAGMIFIRNDNGSHNPREAMEIDDFTRATELLAWTLATIDRKA